MFKLIKKGAKLSEENKPLLWAEIFTFSVIPGLFFHAWLATVIMLPVLSWLINRPNGMFYMIFAVSLIWGFVPWDEVVCRNDDVLEWKRFTWSRPNASSQNLN